MTDAPPFAGPLIPVDQTILGATVNNPAGEKLGTVEDLMIDATDGRIIYAVMTFGGLLGLGKQYHPVPWELLRYDAPSKAVVVDLDRTRLENSPNYAVDDEWTRRNASEIDALYGINRPPPATGG